MAKSNLMNTRTINYLELIGNGKSFQVPPYQRDYSWSEEQWEDLWNDVVDLIPDREKRHYLGALVVEAKSDRHFLIIDGQQRLATLSLFALAVISRLSSMAEDGIEPRNNRERGRELRNRFVGERDPASLIESSRLCLNETDNELYQDYLIQLRNPLNPRQLPKSNQLLLKCFKYFVKRLEELDSTLGNGNAVASLLSETVARQLLFILITVDDEVNAYTVFETLNARGLALTTTDLLKNYLFSKINLRADLEVLQRRWRTLIGTVGQARFPEFLRYHLLCQIPKIRSQRLFKLVRDRTRGAEDVFTLLVELESRGELFAAILNPNHGYWIDSPAAKPYIAELNLFRVRQPMPLLFAAWESLSREDFIRVLKLVTAISFRYSVVSSLNTNDLEPVYHRAAKAITDGQAPTPASVFDCLKPIYVSDEKMYQDFALLEIDTRRRKKLAKYVLSRIEAYIGRRSCDPDTDPGTVEHILPENPSEVWNENFPFGNLENWVYRVGNLTLLEAKANWSIGNDAYSSKRLEYEKSGYIVSRNISDRAPEQWTPDLVDDRQKFLAKRAVQIWRSDFV